jgi:hypothetical protein
VAILGPRQSGKTTLARTFSETYFDLEQAEERLRLDLLWESLLGSKTPIILDEAQCMPQIFPKIRHAVDARRKKNGRFMILGSVAPALMTHVAESLAGRLAICELSPILLGEAPRAANVDSLWLRGGFPDGGLIKPARYPQWQKDYLTLISQRDLPNWGLDASPQMTWRLFKMLAAFHGQIWNASSVGANLGISYHTVNRYVDYLQNSYLIHFLQPFHANIHKRLTKSPKLYWSDSGLLHFLMGVSDWNTLLSQPWVGASWEGWVLNQILGTLKASGQTFNANFFRTSDGYEIDLILEFSKGRWALEFKLTGSPGPEDLGRLKHAASWVKADKVVLVSRTLKTVNGGNCVSTNIQGCLDLLLRKG